LSSAGKKTARFLLAGACNSYVPYVRCVGWKPGFSHNAPRSTPADIGLIVFFSSARRRRLTVDKFNYFYIDDVTVCLRYLRDVTQCFEQVRYDWVVPQISEPQSSGGQLHWTGQEQARTCGQINTERLPTGVDSKLGPTG